MTAEGFLQVAALIALGVFTLALVMVAVRILLGPTLPDRIIALDLLVGIVIGLIAAFTLRTGHYAYIDIAIALGLVGFLSTVAFARFVATRGRIADMAPLLPDNDEIAKERQR